MQTACHKFNTHSTSWSAPGLDLLLIRLQSIIEQSFVVAADLGKKWQGIVAMISVIDMGLGNLGSVIQAFQRVGCNVLITNSSIAVSSASAIVLPGVGAFGDGMKMLRKMHLISPLSEHVAAGKPLLGICLGMQLLARSSDEHGYHEGLGFIPGIVERLKSTGPDCRVPNIGWSDVIVHRKNSWLYKNSTEESIYYFAHSYFLRCDDANDVVATIDYGGAPITAAVERGNLLGVQFHPEKSLDAGLQVLAAFVNYVHYSAREVA